MRIYDADITGSLTYNSQTITSFGTVDAVSSSVVDLTNASGSFSTRVTSVESSISNLDNTYATDVEVSTAVSGLNAATSSYLKNTTDTLTGDLTVTGTITAQEFHTEFVSASITYESGSHKFGDTYDDVHEFTGSVNVTNSTGGVTGSYTFIGGNFTISGDDADFNLNITSGSSLANLTEFRFQTDGGTMGRLYMHKGTKHMYLGPTYFPTSSLFLQDGTGTVMTVTGSKVGIGTVEPQAELDVRTSSQQAIYAYTDGGYNALEFTSDGGITTGSLLAYNNTVRLGNASNVGGFSNGIVIDSNGNVGIGTASPTTNLDVNGNIQTNNINIGLGAPTSFGTGVPTIRLQGTAANGRAGSIWFKNYDDYNVAALYVTDDTVDNYGTTLCAYSGSIRFATEDLAAEKMIINPTGNVGIGTTNAEYKLDVRSSTMAAKFTAGDGGYAAVIFDGDAGATEGVLTTHNGIIYIGGINTGGTGGQGEIRIEPSAGNKLYIDSAGNIGINSTGPAYKLDVVGNARFTEQLKVEQPIVTWSDSGTKHYTHLATFSGYGSSASALIINTNIPGHNQSGNGNMFTFRIVGYAYGNFGLIDMLVGCYAGENNYYSAWWTGTCQTNWVDNVYVYTNSSGKVAFQIGETTDTLAAEIAITDFVQGFGNVNTSYADSWSCQAVTTLPTQTQKTTLGYKAVAPDIYEDVTFHNNVGIGDTTSIGSMTSGGGLLTIGRNGSLGTDDVVGALSFHTNDASFTAYHADGISAQISAHSDNPNGASGRLSFYTAYGGSRGERMRITSNGDVGIGATSPYNYSGYKSLTIGNGSSTGLVKFGTGADANGPEIFSSTSTGGLIFNSSSTGTRFRYYSSAGEYSFSTNGPSTGNGVAFYAEHTTQSTGFHYYFRFLESQTNASAAGIKAGGILASATYSVANPDRGDIYAQDNISALSFTDRTPYPSSLEVAKAVVNSHQRRTDAEIEELVTAAYNRIQSQVDDMPQPEKEALTLEQYKAKYSKEYELDHNVLHDYVNDTKYADQGIEARDLSATVSCLVEVVKDLMQRIDTLEGN